MVRTHNLDEWWTELERLERVLGRVGPDEVCCEGLTPRQTSILRTLVQREGARLMDLALAACISPSAMTRVIEKLEKRGLVRRVRGAHDDGRAAMVRITEEGRKARARVDRLMQQRTAAILATIPPAERTAVLEALRILNHALEATGCCGVEDSELVQIESKRTETGALTTEDTEVAQRVREKKDEVKQ